MSACRALNSLGASCSSARAGAAAPRPPRPAARPCGTCRAPRLLLRATQNDGEAWRDAPDTPRVNGSGGAGAATAADADEWRNDIQSLAASLRVDQVRHGRLGKRWDATASSWALLRFSCSRCSSAGRAGQHRWWLALATPAHPPARTIPWQSLDGSSDGYDWDSYPDEEREKCFLVGVQVGAGV